MYILGISALYHDSAAALIHDGEIVAASQEERYTRIKHDFSFPKNAIQYCMECAEISPADLDAVVYYDDPILTLDRFLANLAAIGNDNKVLENGWQSMFSKKLWIADEARRSMGILGKNDELLCTRHHLSHAASAFYPSPFKNAAILTLDGVGEWNTTSVGYGEGNHIEILRTIDYPHSLGLLYSAFTYFCGFKVNYGDYKLMGLAPYGQPRYQSLIEEKLIDIKEDGSFRLNMEYFAFQYGECMISKSFERLFKGVPRLPESDLTQREMDLAASVQKTVEKIVVRLARTASKLTGQSENLVLAGGVALNCVANGVLSKEGIFKNIWIQPAAGDAGGALGAALAVYYEKFGMKRHVKKEDSQKGSFLGNEYSDEEIKEFLFKNGYPYKKYEDENELYNVIAKNIDGKKVIGIFEGRMEYGPRALGHRSIIADARDRNMQSRLNMSIKFRESFRPFAPAVLEEDVDKYFHIAQGNPYMLICGEVKNIMDTEFSMDNYLQKSQDLIPIINRKRSDIPAVTHVDYSARIQTVNRGGNPFFYGVLEAFKRLTGCSVVINTSFNVRGEPIVCSLEDAYYCFMHTGMDMLVLGKYVLYKGLQPKWKGLERKYESD